MYLNRKNQRAKIGIFLIQETDAEDAPQNISLYHNFLMTDKPVMDGP
jgi:hypothetical protein